MWQQSGGAECFRGAGPLLANTRAGCHLSCINSLVGVFLVSGVTRLRAVFQKWGSRGSEGCFSSCSVHTGRSCADTPSASSLTTVTAGSLWALTILTLLLAMSKISSVCYTLPFPSSLQCPSPWSGEQECECPRGEHESLQRAGAAATTICWWLVMWPARCPGTPRPSDTARPADRELWL